MLYPKIVTRHVNSFRRQKRIYIRKKLHINHIVDTVRVGVSSSCEAGYSRDAFQVIFLSGRRPSDAVAEWFHVKHLRTFDLAGGNRISFSWRAKRRKLAVQRCNY